MIALLSALLGFFSSAVPDMFKLFRDAKDRAHELAILKLQIDYDREKLASAATENAQTRHQQLQAIEAQNLGQEQLALNARIKDSLTGIHWVDALSGSVRPMITYAFFGLYVLVKAAQFSLLMQSELPWQNDLSVAQALVSLWTEEDVAIFSAIMAFWFGSRAMLRAKR
jgi:hypothetical protein